MEIKMWQLLLVILVLTIYSVLGKDPNEKK